MITGKSSYKFPIQQIIKQSRPGNRQPVLILPAYPADRRLCVITYLKAYLDPQGGSTYCFTAVSVSVRSHPKAPPARFFFWVHQNMIPAIQRSFSTGDLNLQGQGQACRGHHLKNHLN